MSGLQNRKAQSLQKPFPGCMGRMINIFDLSAGMAGTKLLTDKAHRDGSPNRRNRTDVVKKSIDPIAVHEEDKPITSELRKSSSSKKSGGTPMKMLIAQEMSKEIDSRRKQPGVVARLMGLDDALPIQSSGLTSKGSSDKRGHSSRATLAGGLQDCRQQEDDYFDRSMPCEVHSCTQERKEYRDVYEVWQQRPRASHHSDQVIQKGRYCENQYEKRMDLVRQKFLEAKRLATDERLLQSKEFQDALEVLSSNRDLFLKFLEEPNSLFSKHLKDLNSIPPPPQTKRITVLKPSRVGEIKGENELKKHPASSEGGRDLNKPHRKESVNQSTRIVVLKPSPVKHHDVKPIVNPQISKKEVMKMGNFHQDSETGETLESREVAKEITRQMRESLNSKRRDESLLSSVLSNGYVGDDGSFNRSENEFIEEVDGEYSDMEIVTPISRHSWDYTNRFGSPYSLSSFSRASYSPESSVIREAKKRLSERWSLVASNGITQEQKETRRSSSTLGEMLAIPEVKKEERGGGLSVSSSRSYGGEEDLRVSTVCSFIGRAKDGNGGERSPPSLSRSKSVPVSSSAYDNMGVITEAASSQTKKVIVSMKEAKSKNVKSSFAGKVSSLFFSRNKKSGTEKSISYPLVGAKDEIQSSSVDPVGKKNDDLSKSVCNSLPGDGGLRSSEEESIKAASSTSVKDGAKQGTITFRAALSLEKPITSGSLCDNQDNPGTSQKSSGNQEQPSPTSVLDAPFEDDANNSMLRSSEASDAGQPKVPIESIARTLSWDDTNLETSLPNNVKLPKTMRNAHEEVKESFLFVQKLLSTAGLDNDKLSMVLTKWHSIESPLDPTLLDKFLDRKEEEARSRERRSNQRLLFDCVNSALLEIGRTAYLGAYPWGRTCAGPQKEALAGTLVGSKVWVLVKGWFSGVGNCESGETDNGSLVVEGLLRRGVEGTGWSELMQSEIDEISKDIGREVLEELVEEALADFTVSCL